MPVERFRTFDEAAHALELRPGDPRIHGRLRRLAELARSVPVRRGVSRFHSVSEAKAHKWATDDQSTDDQSTDDQST